MEKKMNNYVIIIAVLLLVVAIIVGAGLCYLSWADEYIGGSAQTGNASTGEFTGNNDSGEHAGTAEDNETSAIEGSESADTEDSATTSTEASPDKEGGNGSGDVAGGSQSAGTEVSGETTETNGTDGSEADQDDSKDTLAANTVTMDQISISAEGEYTYMKDGRVASYKGLDVSKYQKNIDWKKVAGDGIEYAFIRAGSRGYGGGDILKDGYFHQNVKGALEAGIQVGAYFYSQAINVKEAVEEAEFVIGELKGYDITYPVAVDIERVEGDKARQDALSTEERTEVCIAFCERIKEAGYIPMVYGDLETFAELVDPSALAAYDFWICETDGKMTFPYEFAVWQYSHEGSVDGVSGDTSISISLKKW